VSLSFEYRSPNVNYRHIFLFNKGEVGYVDILTFIDGQGGGAAWLHPIKDGKIVLRSDNNHYMQLLPDAVEFINKLIKLKAFF
jgi:hypothetical protein